MKETSCFNFTQQIVKREGKEYRVSNKERKFDGNDRKSSVSYIENLDTVELKFNNVFKLSFENENAKSYYNSLVVSITSYSSNTK